MDQSEGTFDMKTWEKVYDAAQHICCDGEDEEAMEVEDSVKQTKLKPWVEDLVELKIEEEQKWKNG